MAVILGIDPGTQVAGFGAIESDGRRLRLIEFGCVDIRKVEPFADRLKSLYEGLGGVMRRVRPDEAAFEKVFAGKNAATALKMGEGRGVALVCAANHGIRVLEFSPKAVKKAVTGRGDAAKEQVQEMVRMLLGLETPPSPDHASDALAIAICGANRMLSGESGR